MMPILPRFDQGFFILLFGYQTLLFLATYHREVAWFPPAYFDQAHYLVNAYRLQEEVLNHGLGRLRSAVWNPNHATGVALPVEGALSGLIIGGARFPQLCVNLILFFALQVVAFNSARAWLRNRSGAYVLVGLLLCEATPWLPAGGLFDFRIDFPAFCLYGIWTCCVLRSDLFLQRSWAITSGAVGALLILHRFLTSVYFAGVLALFTIVCFVFWRRTRNVPVLSKLTWQRLKNLGLACVVLCILGSPIVLVNLKAIWNYYVVGHVLNEEKFVRAGDLGLHNAIDHLLFYPESIVRDHLGSAFFWAAGVLFAIGVTAYFLCRSVKVQSAEQPGVNNRHLDGKQQSDPTMPVLQIIFLLIAIVFPILALTADISKSPVVGGIVGVPTALLVAYLGQFFFSKQNEPGLSSRLFAASVVLIVGLGAYNQLSRSGRHWPEFSDRDHLSRIAELNQWLVNFASDHRWKHPTISLDVISSALNASAITATGFEKTGQLVDFQGLLGSSIFALSRERALELLAQSDFFILTSSHQFGSFPFGQSIAAYLPDLKAWADKHLTVVRVQRFETSYPYTATVYARPSARLREISGDWITSAGLLIEADRRDLERFPLIRLKGTADFASLPKLPAVTAHLEPSEKSSPVIGIFRRLGKDQYEITLDTSSMQLPTGQQVLIRLKFDTFFIRKDAALHDDFRELVVRSPDVTLLPAGE